MVLPADKGRPSVVMDVNTYHAKISSLIKNGPPDSEAVWKAANPQVKRTSNSRRLQQDFRPRHKKPPRFYRLPKIHKAEVPPRPIVSCFNTYLRIWCIHLFSYLLSPLTNNSDFTVNNSAVKTSERIRDNDIMVSFDVESLFMLPPFLSTPLKMPRYWRTDPSNYVYDVYILNVFAIFSLIPT